MRPSPVVARTLLASAAVFAITLGFSASARAGGWDTPMLYTARHMGMGGTAVSYVHDPSALFHNPAGLAHTRFISLIGDFSLLLGTIEGNPNEDALMESIDSNTTIAPFFLAGASFRIASFLTAGIAVYPVASAGATYEYTDGESPVEDRTRILFIEVSPGIALQIPSYPNLSIGFGYRATFVTLERSRHALDDPDPELELDLSGSNFEGFRLGAQWQPIPQLQIGISYRHKTTTDLESDSGRALGVEIENPSTSLTLPSRLSFGVRGNLGAFSAAVDLEYGFNSQNQRAAIVVGGGLMVPNIFAWEDAITLRLGAEYRIPASASMTISPRLGFIYDAQTSNEGYPSAFGTPPAPTMVFTGGGGLDGGPWELNLAVGYRFGSTNVSDSDVEASDSCPFCGAPGDYSIGLLGLYIDFSYEFEGP